MSEGTTKLWWPWAAKVTKTMWSGRAVLGWGSSGLWKSRGPGCGGVGQHGAVAKAWRCRSTRGSCNASIRLRRGQNFDVIFQKAICWTTQRSIRK